MSIRTRRTRILGVAGAVQLIAGVIAIVIAVRAQKSAPQPPPAAASPVNVIPPATPSGPGSTGPHPRTGHQPCSRTEDMRADPGPLAPDPAANPGDQGRQQPEPDRTEQHGRDLDNAAGQGLPCLLAERLTHPRPTRPVTIIGHVDSVAYGPGVCFKLGNLRQRDTISISRADGRVAVFEVERVVEYPKAKFPTQAVYGKTDNAALRLITYGGLFDPSQLGYESNIVVCAALVSTHHA